MGREKGLILAPNRHGQIKLLLLTDCADDQMQARLLVGFKRAFWCNEERQLGTFARSQFADLLARFGKPIVFANPNCHRRQSLFAHVHNGQVAPNGNVFALTDFRHEHVAIRWATVIAFRFDEQLAFDGHHDFRRNTPTASDAGNFDEQPIFPFAQVDEHGIFVGNEMAVNETFMHEFAVEPNSEPILTAEQKQRPLRSVALDFRVSVGEPVAKLPKLWSFLANLLCHQRHEIQNSFGRTVSLPSDFA